MAEFSAGLQTSKRKGMCFGYSEGRFNISRQSLVLAGSQFSQKIGGGGLHLFGTVRLFKRIRYAQKLDKSV